MAPILAPGVVVETGVVVVGLGYSGSAIARVLLGDPKDNAPCILVDKREGEMVTDLILSEAGAVAGVLLARGGAVEPVRASAVVLATGSAAGLFPGGDWLHSGDGLAIAHRAGVALSKPHLVANEVSIGVPCRPDGATTLPGLFVAGHLGADKPDPARVARAAIARSREGAEAFGPYAIHPTIDEPLPAGFADVKFERLRALTGRAFAGAADRAETLQQLHRLKGEADEFARARVDAQLFSLQNACEVALLVFKGA